MRGKSTHSIVEDAIAKRCLELNLEFDKQLRVKSPEDNLMELFKNWEEIRKELEKCNGSELKPENGLRPKFCSIFSSSCLCVNSFALMKALPEKTNIVGLENSKLFRFEDKLKTGISVPNIDIYIENEDSILGVESKFTEILKPKNPNWKNNKKIGNLQNYLNRQKEIKCLPEGFAEKVIRFYIDKKVTYHLDVAQLIKHVLGLINRSVKLKKKPKLLYIYWQPINAQDFEIYQKHEHEIVEFSGVIKDFIDFTAMPYDHLWDLLKSDTDYAKIIANLKSRYGIKAEW